VFAQLGRHFPANTAMTNNSQFTAESFRFNV